MSLVFLAITIDCPNIGTIDVDGTSQNQQVKTADQRDSRVLVQIDGEFSIAQSYQCGGFLNLCHDVSSLS